MSKYVIVLVCNFFVSSSAPAAQLIIYWPISNVETFHEHGLLNLKIGSSTPNASFPLDQVIIIITALNKMVRITISETDILPRCPLCSVS